MQRPEPKLSSMPRCPSCEMFVEVAPTSKFLPFCSERCRLVDLGRWLNEEHTLTCEDEADDQAGTQQRNGPVLPPGWHDA
jgi:endogenous inhibitor of DNA gyrase (YacG/DUF329 family)